VAVTNLILFFSIFNRTNVTSSVTPLFPNVLRIHLPQSGIKWEGYGSLHQDAGITGLMKNPENSILSPTMFNFGLATRADIF
jgi:hypothetical protein